MLLKYSQAQKRVKSTGSGKPQRATGMMKLSTSNLVSVMPRIHRRVIKAASKRPVCLSSSASTTSSAAHHHGHHHHHRTLSSSTKREERVPVDPCDNSNDSGLGFDHFDYPLASQPTLHFSDKEASWPEELPEVKRKRLEIKLESDDANDNFTFPESVTHNPRTLCAPVSRISREKISPPIAPYVPPTLTAQLSSTSRDGRVQLQILCQPEQQHRARYQTEGSRGAVKDRTGNGFPVVKLVGYNKTTTLQVFIGTDQGRVAPHMFYQACRVSGKNSTPCTERKVDGTMVIEVDAEPSKDMIVTCDCVGILKERNVDVEHRFPEESSARSKKKSTRCRMVFRTIITHPNGATETLQVTSQPIVCTQPPGVPEICKKSLSSCPAAGGLELFILGKNFLKDTRVVFQEAEGSASTWKQTVQPDKEFLQQSHLVCTVPPYQCQDIKESVNVRLCVESSSKCSEPHVFVYTPNPATVSAAMPDTKISAASTATRTAALPSDGHIVSPGISPKGNLVVGNIYPPSGMTAAHSLSMPTQLIMPAEPSAAATTFITTSPETARTEEKVHPLMLWQTSVPEMEKPMEMLPPDLLPIAVRRPSLQMIVPETLAPEELKREVTDSPVVTVQSLPPLATVADLSSTQSPSMDTLRQFVSPDQNAPLPSLSLDNYLTNLENGTPTCVKPHQLIGEVPQILVPTVTTATTPSGKTVYVDNSTALENQLLSNNETSRVIIETTSPIQYTSAAIVSNANCNQENLGVIVTSSSAAGEVQALSMEQTQTSQINDLVSSSMVRRTSLDAFVNSAAESHISPGGGSNIMMPPPPPPDSVLQTIAAVQTSSIDASQTTNQTLADTSLCSLLRTTLPDQPATQETPSLANLSLPHHLSTQSTVINAAQFEEQQQQQKFTGQEVISTRQQETVERKETDQFVMPLPPVSQDSVIVTAALPKQPEFELKATAIQKVAQVTVKKCEEGMPLPHELTQMSENDLISYINPSCFDQV